MPKSEPPPGPRVAAERPAAPPPRRAATPPGRAGGPGARAASTGAASRCPAGRRGRPSGPVRSTGRGRSPSHRAGVGAGGGGARPRRRARGPRRPPSRTAPARPPRPRESDGGQPRPAVGRRLCFLQGPSPPRGSLRTAGDGRPLSGPPVLPACLPARAPARPWARRAPSLPQARHRRTAGRRKEVGVPKRPARRSPSRSPSRPAAAGAAAPLGAQGDFKRPPVLSRPTRKGGRPNLSLLLRSLHGGCGPLSLPSAFFPFPLLFSRPGPWWTPRAPTARVAGVGHRRGRGVAWDSPAHARVSGPCGCSGGVEGNRRGPATPSRERAGGPAPRRVTPAALPPPRSCRRRSRRARRVDAGTGAARRQSSRGGAPLAGPGEPQGDERG